MKIPYDLNQGNHKPPFAGDTSVNTKKVKIFVDIIEESIKIAQTMDKMFGKDTLNENYFSSVKNQFSGAIPRMV